MLDNLNPRDDASGRSRPRRAAEHAQPLADREVPLGSPTATNAVNQWLDGELAESAVGNSRQVALWHRINAETERRREVAAPVDLAARIMAAIPAAEPARDQTVSFWNRPVEITPAAAVAAAASLIALGAALNASLRMR